MEKNTEYEMETFMCICIYTYIYIYTWVAWGFIGSMPNIGAKRFSGQALQIMNQGCRTAAAHPQAGPSKYIDDHIHTHSGLRVKG